MALKKNTKIIILLATAALLTTGVAFAAHEGWFNFIFETDLTIQDLRLTNPFTLSELEEYFIVSVTMIGSRNTGQEHEVTIIIEHCRTEGGDWEADASYILALENMDGTVVDPIYSDSFSGLKESGQETYIKEFIWIPTADPANYMMVLNLMNVKWLLLVDYTITSSAGPGGSITPSGAVPVLEGYPSGFMIEPDAGYAIEDVLLDGTTSLGPVSDYLFESVTADHTIEASFTELGVYNEVHTMFDETGEKPPVGGTVINCTFNGETLLSILPGSNVHVEMVFEVDGSAYQGYHFDYHFDAEIVYVGGRHQVGELVTNAGPFDETGTCVASMDFPAEPGIFGILLIVDAVYPP